MREVRNIIIINDFDFVNGGTSQIAITTANVLVKRGFKVAFFSAVHNSSRNDLSDEVRQYSTHQFDILSHPKRSAAAIQGIWNKKAAEELSVFLNDYDEQDTVIHLHGWMKALSPAIGKVLVNRKFAVVCTLHDYFVACPNGGFYNFQTNAICRLEPMGPACICTHCDVRNYAQKSWRVARQFVQKNMARIPSGIHNFITVSKFSRKILEPFLPASARIFPISNPISYPFEHPVRASSPTGGLLYVGRLSPEKGPGLACEAAVSKGLPLTVIGDGELRTALEQQYPQVVFKGWLTPREVFNEMLHARALVFPSLLYETQGLSILEALSVGLPVIVSRECAGSELVSPGSGILFNNGEVAELAAGMNKIYHDPDLREQMSQAAFEHYWSDPFSLDKYVGELTDAYTSMLNEREKRG